MYFRPNCIWLVAFLNAYTIVPARLIRITLAKRPVKVNAAQDSRFALLDALSVRSRKCLETSMVGVFAEIWCIRYRFLKSIRDLTTLFSAHTD